AIAAAERLGFRAEIEPGTLPLARVHADDVETALTVPLEDAHAIVHFETTKLNPITSVYILLSVIAGSIAGIFGSRIGALFSEDVALARHGVRATGVADVIRGTRILREARFVSVSALMNSIDDLGGVFREFASAQQKAIDARGATERMRGLFLASMSHDLKAPLNAILGFTEIVSHSPLSPAQKESLAIVEQRGRELLVLIQTILDSARAEAGALEVHREWTMVRDVVMSAVLDARDLAVVTEVQVEGEVAADLPKVYIDPERIVQALTAVISSAVRFTDKGGVHVLATRPGPSDRLLVAVETSGKGLPVEERDKIFEAFKYADKARLHGSLGLGLALARHIIEIHGGEIEVDTSKEGGLAFRVWLPTTEMTMSRLRHAFV
ncbi:MAG: ATP-binding protein, partial [Polyangiaceae bacterium]